MNSEQLLKSISDLIKKNQKFFSENPEIFLAVQDRLVKAIDYDDPDSYEELMDRNDPSNNEDDEDYYNQGYDESGISDLFDDIPEEDVDEDGDGEISTDEADDWLKENDPSYEEYKDTDGDGDIDMKDVYDTSDLGQDIDTDGDLDLPEQTKQEIKAKDAQTDKKKVSSSGYRDWSPKDKYHPDHDSKIKQFMSEGWSHREAERLAGAHEAPSNFYDALKSKIKPTQPSEKMLEHMRGIAGDWLRNAERKISESAEAKKNPIKHASAKALTAHEDAIGDFKTAYDAFLNSDSVKNLRGRDRHQAIQSFKQKWETDNPSHREKIIGAADAGKVFGSAMKERAQHLEEGKQSILEAGKINPDAMGSAGEFSSGASGGMEGMTHQGAAQMAGGSQEEEGGYTTGTTKDPSMLFAEKNPEYIKHLQSKLTSKLNPEQTSRLNSIKTIKGNK